LRRLGELAEVADSYELLPHPRPNGESDPRAFRAVWAEAEAMRRSGALGRLLRRVRSPVLVIHGTTDPHPLRGVVEPLRKAGVKLRVVALSRCGHEPWRERYARERFFAVLRKELARP
jgi:pimeloyl-ACP methyl ester carboxylesterase